MKKGAKGDYIATSVRLSAETDRIWEEAAAAAGLSKASCLEAAVRMFALQYGINIKREEQQAA